MKKKVVLKNRNNVHPILKRFYEDWAATVVLGVSCTKITRMCSPGAVSVPGFSPEAIEALLMKLRSILCLKCLFHNGTVSHGPYEHQTAVTSRIMFVFLQEKKLDTRDCHANTAVHFLRVKSQFWWCLPPPNYFLSNFRKPNFKKSVDFEVHFFFQSRFSTLSRSFQKLGVVLRESSGSK